MTSRSLLVVNGSIALAAMLGLSLSPATADCPRQLLPKFNAIQENGFAVVFDLDEVVNGTTQGEASYYSDNGVVEGCAEAKFDGRNLEVWVFWGGVCSRGSPGKYEGYISSDGSLAGITYDLGAEVRSEVFFRSKQTFPCAVVAEPAKPAKRLGKKKTPPPPPEEDNGIIMQPDIKGLIQ